MFGDGDSHLFRHADQLGQRIRLHFAQELAAMDFGGGFAHSKFSGDLFIEQTG